MGVERKHIVIAIVFGMACGVALLIVPRALAALTFWLGYGSLKHVLFDRLGFSDSVSDVIAGAFAFFMPMATYVLFANVLAVWTGRADASRLAKTFAAYALVYLLPHALTAIVDSSSTTCFDQRTGAPRMYYSFGPSGQILLSDSAGFDQFGVARKPVTQEICRIADRQKRGAGPRRLAGDPCQVEFFDPAGGGVRVYYSQGADGAIELFDGPGVNPSTDEPLRPANADIAAQLCRRAQDERREHADEARRKAEREQALGLIRNGASSSATGFECGIDETGASLHLLPGPAAARYEFARLTAFSTYASFNRGPDGAPRRTAFVVELRADDDAPGHQIRCILQVANPAAIDVSPQQRQRSNQLLDSLERLGVRIGSREPDLQARRAALLPKGPPPGPGVYGCLRGGRSTWCSGADECGQDGIPVVTGRCEIMANGERMCGVACAR